MVAALLLAGCQKEEPAPPKVLTIDDILPKQAQPKLPTTKLWLGPETLITELAVNQEQMSAGMMFRSNMADNEAMLFAFPEPLRASFWMKNVTLPLSAAYVASDGTILEIHPLQPQDTNSVTAASDNVQFVIETTQGWFQRHNISTGVVVRTEQGSLMDLYRGKQ